MIKVINLNALLITTSLMAPVSFADDPFGFDINVSPAKYDYCSLTDKGNFKCTNAPKPHPEFEDYYLWFIDDMGLCRLVAGAKLIERDSYGQKTREKIENIKEQLKKKYGEPGDHIDFLRGSVWDDPRDWMMGIFQNERVFGYYWFPPKYKQVGNVNAIVLDAGAANNSDGYFTLKFEYNNLDACLKRRDDKESDAF